MLTLYIQTGKMTYSLRVLAALLGGLSLGLSTPKKFSSSEVVTPDSVYPLLVPQGS